MKYCATCNNIKCRCDSCVALIEQNYMWYCTEYDKSCEDVQCCLLYDDISSCE